MESRLFRGHGQLEMMLMVSDAERLANYAGGQELTEGFPLRSELAHQWGEWIDDVSEFIINAVMEDSHQVVVVRDRLKAAWQTAQEHVKLMFATHKQPTGMTRAQHVREIRNTYRQWARHEYIYGDIMPPHASHLEVTCRQRLHPLLVAFLLSDPPLRLEFNSDLAPVPLDKPVDTIDLREVLVLPAVYAGDECVCRSSSLFIRSS
jgi:hypothetical protein